MYELPERNTSLAPDLNMCSVCMRVASVAPVGVVSRDKDVASFRGPAEPVGSVLKPFCQGMACCLIDS